jgi:DNA-directed RNA polymerase specialized sigma24 family protein
MRWVVTRLARAIGRQHDHAEDDLRQLVALAARWPKPMREVFTLRKVYGLRPCTIARMLTLSHQDVEHWLISAALACADLGPASHPGEPTAR